MKETKKRAEFSLTRSNQRYTDLQWNVDRVPFVRKLTFSTLADGRISMWHVGKFHSSGHAKRETIPR